MNRHRFLRTVPSVTPAHRPARGVPFSDRPSMCNREFFPSSRARGSRHIRRAQSRQDRQGIPQGAENVNKQDPKPLERTCVGPLQVQLDMGGAFFGNLRYLYPPAPPPPPPPSIAQHAHDLDVSGLACPDPRRGYGTSLDLLPDRAVFSLLLFDLVQL